MAVLNANRRSQSLSESSVFSHFSEDRGSLITVWLEVRVLPGPPIFSICCGEGERRVRRASGQCVAEPYGPTRNRRSLHSGHKHECRLDLFETRTAIH